MKENVHSKMDNNMEDIKELETQETPAAETTTAEPTPAPVAERKAQKRVLTGKVVSNKSDKTVVVLIERQVKHPLYKKYYKESKKVMAHDEANDCGIGDTVRIRECRPLSAKKRWEMIDVVERAK